MKKLVFFIMSIILIVLLCSVPAMAVEIKDLIYCTDVPDKYEDLEPVLNHFVYDDKFAIIVPFGDITLIENPERRVEIETFLTLISPEGIKIYDEISSGLFTQPLSDFDPDKAWYYQWFYVLPWLSVGEYTIIIKICDYLNNTEDLIQSTFYIHAVKLDC